MNQIRCPLSRTAEKNPKLTALLGSEKLITFGILDKLVHLTAINLAKKGIQRGTRVAILGVNNPAYCILILAILRIGAVICPINNRLPQKAVHEALQQIECKTLVLVNYTENVFVLRGIKILMVEDLVADLIGKQTLRGQPVVSLQNPAAIVFTSGTGAAAKAVQLSYGNFYYNVLGANERIPFHEKHRWLLTLPLYHVGGLGILFRAIIGGGAMVIPTKDESITEAITKYEITHLSLVPTQLYRLLKGPVPKIKGTPPIVLTGGGPVSKELLQKCRKANLKVYRTYGLTEMASQVTTGKCIRGTHSGKLLKYREIKIASDNEILVKGATLFEGYIKNDKIELPVDSDGWFHTGDMGRLDRSGFMTVLGRQDNMFISGGENIHPEEIELQLLKIEGVEAALVVGLSDREFGMRPAAFVKFSEEHVKSEKEMTAELEKSLPRFKIPRFYFDWPEHLSEGALKLPRSAFLKLAQDLTAKYSPQTQEVSS